MDRASQFISFLLHPLFIPSYTFGILYFFAPELVKPLSIRTLPFLFFTTCLIPLISITMWRVSLKGISLRNIKEIVREMRLESKEDRRTPFMMFTFYYAVTAYLFIFKIHVNQTVASIFVATGLLLLVLTVITFWYKISVHAAGISGLCGLFLALVLNYPSETINNLFLLIIVLAGLVMSARLQLNAHTPREILAGAISGAGVCFLILDFFG